MKLGRSPIRVRTALNRHRNGLCYRSRMPHRPFETINLRNMTMAMEPPAIPPGTVPADVASKKLAAGICGIVLGSLGVHKFILGLTTPGIILLVVTLVTCGFGAAITGVIGLVEGIVYLTKSDAEFYQTYIIDKKQWF